MTHARPSDGVLFDLDDTLYDHQFASRRALGALRARYRSLRPSSIANLGREYDGLMDRLHPLTLAGRLPPQDARRARVRLLFRAHGESITADEACRRAAVYRNAYLSAERAVPGAEEVVRALCARAYRVGVVTNNSVRGQRRKLRVCRLEPYVQTLVVSQAVGVSKPDPRIFRIALRRLGVEPIRAVMVGDSLERDVSGARAAGIPGIWFNRRREPSPPGTDVPELHSWVPTAAAVTALTQSFP